MKPRPTPISSDEHVLVPTDALDQLLECIWEWAFEDYRATTRNERDSHFFQHIVRLDAALHDLTVDECWERIEAWWQEQQGG